MRLSTHDVISCTRHTHMMRTHTLTHTHICKCNVTLYPNIDMMKFITHIQKYKNRLNEAAFFEQEEIYWVPASSQTALYDQLAKKKYREILRQQIQWVPNYWQHWSIVFSTRSNGYVSISLVAKIPSWEINHVDDAYSLVPRREWPAGGGAQCMRKHPAKFNWKEAEQSQNTLSLHHNELRGKIKELCCHYDSCWCYRRI